MQVSFSHLFENVLQQYWMWLCLIPLLF